MLQHELDGGDDGVGGGEDVEDDEAGEEDLAEVAALLQRESCHVSSPAQIKSFSSHSFKSGDGKELSKPSGDTYDMSVGDQIR